MNIGLIAHDNKKKLMENLCIAYRHILCKHDIYATGTTGRLVEEAANLVVHKYLSAHTWAANSRWARRLSIMILT